MFDPGPIIGCQGNDLGRAGIYDPNAQLMLDGNMRVRIERETGRANEVVGRVDPAVPSGLEVVFMRGARDRKPAILTASPSDRVGVQIDCYWNRRAVEQVERVSLDNAFQNIASVRNREAPANDQEVAVVRAVGRVECLVLLPWTEPCHSTLPAVAILHESSSIEDTIIVIGMLIPL